MTSQPTHAPFATGDVLIKLAEAAKALGISHGTLYKLMDRGELPYVKIGKCRRISRAALRDYVQRHTVGPRHQDEDGDTATAEFLGRGRRHQDDDAPPGVS